MTEIGKAIHTSFVLTAIALIIGWMILGGGLELWIAEGHASPGRMASIAVGIICFFWWISAMWFKPDWFRAAAEMESSAGSQNREVAEHG